MAILTHQKNMSEKIEQAEIIEQTGHAHFKSEYTEGYRDAVFSIWYAADKPTARRLLKMIPDPAEFGLTSGYPQERVLNGWINEKFLERAVVIDQEVARQIQERLIAEKVKMLNDHVDLGVKMREMGMTFFEENPGKINANAAVRLIVEGARIERESRGIGRSLEQMMDKTDEELLRDIQHLLSLTPVEIQALPESLPDFMDEDDAV